MPYRGIIRSELPPNNSPRFLISTPGFPHLVLITPNYFMPPTTEILPAASATDNNNRELVNQQLRQAVAALNQREVRSALAKGADPNCHDLYSGERLLSCAISKGSRTLLEILLEAGADPRLGNRNRSKPLHFAAGNCKPQALEVLLAHGAHPEAGNACGETALHMLGDNRNRFIFECAQILIRHGADLEARCRSGRTPLLTACRNGNVGLANAMLTLGADVQARDRAGNSCLNLLVEWDYSWYSDDAKIALLGALLNKGVKPYATRYAPSPLSGAVYRGSLRMVKKLLAAGANPARRMHGWPSPLEKAIESAESFNAPVAWALFRKREFSRSVMTRLWSTTVQYGSEQEDSVKLIKQLFKRGIAPQAITEADFADFRLMFRQVAKNNRARGSSGIPLNTRLFVSLLNDLGCEVPTFVTVALL